ncbi:DUF4190 domain-containing protein [Streptomyces rectiverticillatus]|uniref:DUF4190 domain-containing protein n=1 Tax=Streptomyces rectiverticillatus TaxID=173860 RepID=UPI0015C311B8|nr:DUF4190 domain-containing protein [Streptomyces rectiverticillatus]QLE71931.1 DUF4190 domain-containing protein [Streptomyces rectiverticillatus]
MTMPGQHYGHPGAYYPPYPPPAPRNGLGTAAMIVGICGAAIGLVPFLFFLSGPLGVTALILGLCALRLVRRGEAMNRGMALTGTILGGVATVMAVGGLLLMLFIIDKADEESDEPYKDRAPAAAAPDPSPSASAAEKPLKFGETYTYKDGVTVTVAEPEEYELDRIAVGHGEGNLALRLKVTIVNNSKDTLDLRTHVPYVRDADGARASEIFDGRGATKVFTGKLLPGKRATTGFTYSVPPSAAKELQVETGANNDRPDVMWTGPGREKRQLETEAGNGSGPPRGAGAGRRA